MQEESSSYDCPSFSRFDSRHLTLSERTDGPSYSDIIRTALRRYEDVEDSDFVLLMENEQQPLPLTHSNSYMLNNFRTVVPIGANFQVVIPPMLTESAYRARTSEAMRTLKILKINDPAQGEEFYLNYFQFIEEKLGPGRTYEDVNHLRNAFNRLGSRFKFDDYLKKNLKHWETYFRHKERSLAPRGPVKKKKKRGTIPI